jgi:hypothetical protein
MFCGERLGDLSDMLAGLIVSALMLFWVIALAFTARMDRILAGAADPGHPAEFDGMEDL